MENDKGLESYVGNTAIHYINVDKGRLGSDQYLLFDNETILAFQGRISMCMDLDMVKYELSEGVQGVEGRAYRQIVDFYKMR